MHEAFGLALEGVDFAGDQGDGDPVSTAIAPRKSVVVKCPGLGCRESHPLALFLLAAVAGGAALGVVPGQKRGARIGQPRLDALPDGRAVVLDGQRIVGSGLQHDFTGGLLAGVQRVERDEFAVQIKPPDESTVPVMARHVYYDRGGKNQQIVFSLLHLYPVGVGPGEPLL